LTIVADEFGYEVEFITVDIEEAIQVVEDREEEKKNLYAEYMESPIIRQLEEFAEQTRALKELKEMAASYGFDISKPASNGIEAVQWTYFAYLGASVAKCPK